MLLAIGLVAGLFLGLARGDLLGGMAAAAEQGAFGAVLLATLTTLGAIEALVEAAIFDLVDLQRIGAA
ncbi:hypothetical protein [Nannocystis pusilla]|uniref:hypothetical protein n=1 Tax=Nannocystis pusilla TaxID=889268 RepID=UPI003B79DC26